MTFYADHFTDVLNDGSGELRYYYKGISDLTMNYQAQVALPDRFDLGFKGRLVNTSQSKEFNYAVASCNVMGSIPAAGNAKILADALLRLKLEFEDDYGAAANVAFDKSVEPYRSGQPAPPVPDDVNKLDVQARVAIDRKIFGTAADLYSKALALAPWWADGHFNQALILGEMGASDAAMVEMQRYLYLKPDASDLPAVKVKIAEWETPAFAVEVVSTPAVKTTVEVPLHVAFAFVYTTKLGEGGQLNFMIPMPLKTSWSRLFLEIGASWLVDGSLATGRSTEMIPLALSYEIDVMSSLSIIPRVGFAPYATSPPRTSKVDFSGAAYGGASLTLGGASRLMLSGDFYANSVRASFWSLSWRF